MSLAGASRCCATPTILRMSFARVAEPPPQNRRCYPLTADSQEKRRPQVIPSGPPSTSTANNLPGKSLIWNGVLRKGGGFFRKNRRPAGARPGLSRACSACRRSVVVATTGEEAAGGAWPASRCFIFCHVSQRPFGEQSAGRPDLGLPAAGSVPPRRLPCGASLGCRQAGRTRPRAVRR